MAQGLLQQLHADGWAPQPLPWCADAFVVHGESLGHHQALAELHEAIMGLN